VGQKHLTPRANNEISISALNKYKSRSSCLALSGRALSLVTSSCNVRVVPVLGYLMQLSELPKDMKHIENCALQRLYHLLHNSFPPHAFFNLKSHLKLPQPTSIYALAMATMIRTAHSTVTVWQEQRALLDASLQEHLPLQKFFPNVQRAQLWDSPPMVDRLFEAHRFFPSRFPLVHAALLKEQRNINPNTCKLAFSRSFTLFCMRWILRVSSHVGFAFGSPTLYMIELLSMHTCPACLKPSSKLDLRCVLRC
jgi:hypothetical protein